MKVAILDDYQNVALKFADWSGVSKHAQIDVFNDHVADTDAAVERLRPYDIVAVMRERTPLRREILERLPNLKMIASNGARNASIDLKAAAERGITVTNSRYTSTPTVELTWALILASSRHLIAEAAAVRNGEWQHSIGEDMAERTLGILGLGSIGTRVAKVAQAFGMKVIAWSQNLTLEKSRSGRRYAGGQRRAVSPGRCGDDSHGSERAHPGLGGRGGTRADESHRAIGQYVARTHRRGSGFDRGVERRENCWCGHRCL
jgi:phosphoglycerate dehydrogenase-like enzyme